MMILGIPNVGKSTLMNALLKRHVAHVGDEPAITKVQMYHQLGPGMTLVDTPGMLWPGMAQDGAYKLAATHSIGRAAYDDEDAATTLGQYLLRHYPELLAQRFGAPPAGCDGHGLLESIATSRSLVKGGGPTSRGPRPRCSTIFAAARSPHHARDRRTDRGARLRDGTMSAEPKVTATFASLGLGAELLRAVGDLGYRGRRPYRRPRSPRSCAATICGPRP